MGAFLKFKLLLWKNFLIQKRKPIATTFEIGLPTLFACILMVLRLQVKSIDHPGITEWKRCTYKHLHDQIKGLTLAYVPGNEATDRIMAQAQDTMKHHFKIESFATEEAFVQAAVPKGTNTTSHYVGGVVFKSGFSLQNGTLMPDKKVVYKLRLSYSPRVVYNPDQKLTFTSDTSWSTNLMFPPYQVQGPRDNSTCSGNPGYAREGFLGIQYAVNDAIIKGFTTGEAHHQYNRSSVHLRRHPYPPYREDKYVLVLQQQFPLVIMLSFVVIVLGIVRDIVLEKERRLKESMKMMGIFNWLHWSAWFTKHFLFLLVSVGIMTLFYCVALDPQKGGVVAETNPAIIFIYLLCFAIATITFCFAASVFFAKANTGAALTGILFFCMYLPYFFLQQRYTTMSFGAKLFACIDFQVAMAFGGTLLGMFEGVGSGIQFSTLSSNVSVDDNFSMTLVLAMLLIDSVIHCLIAWYVESVFPGEYGVPQPWYFPLMPSYWGCGKPKLPLSLGEMVGVGQDPNLFEKEPNENAGIQIRNLRKVYGRGEKAKVAVAGMTLNMYQGQITALLGHNGAGKTTTMSMLTGFYPPTDGTAFVNGFDIQREIGEVRESLGLCPQHDILFDNLTVEEHLIFFGLLKGVPKAEIMPQCEEMLKDTELLPKLNARSKTLSGGMKRKLSVCIALIGNSKIVFLDEPSSGLDPNARRSIWTVLQKNRAGRTMVLSTHFMDEADLLGDRIAIMANGVVKCCGSSLFLKKKYGAGYHMVVVKESVCDVNQVTTVVQSHIVGAELESNVGAELSYILPQGQVQHFEALFTELETRQAQLGIHSFGASVTTMEEVFIRVGEAEDEVIKERLHHNTPLQFPPLRGNAGSDDSPGVSSHSSGSTGTPVLSPGSMGPINGPEPVPMSRSIKWANGSQRNKNGASDETPTNTSDTTLLLAAPVPRMRKNTGWWLHVQQFRAMLVKRMLHTLRNKLVTLSQLIVPLFYTLMGIIVIKTLPSFTEMPELHLSAAQFKENYIPFWGQSAFANGTLGARLYAAQFSGESHTFDVSTLHKGQNYTSYDYLKLVGPKSVATFNLRYQIAADFNCTGSAHPALVSTAYFNNQAYHSIAISMTALYNTIIKVFTNSTEYGIDTYNHPLPQTQHDKITNQGLGKDPTGFTLAFNFTFGMAFLASSFVVFLVKERAVKSKHVQFVSGVHQVNFWLSTFCWDIVNYMCPCVVVIVFFFAFDIGPFTKDLHWLYILFFMFMYGWAMLPYMYLFSFAFLVPATAYVWITMFNIISGVLFMLVVVIFSIPQIGLANVSIILEWVFMALFPNFSLAQGTFEFYQNQQNLDICAFVDGYCPILKFLNQTNPCCLDNCGDFCLYHNENFLGWQKNGIGRMFFFLAIQGVVLWVLLFLVEFGVAQKVRNLLESSTGVSAPDHSLSVSASGVQEDEDVARERIRITNMIHDGRLSGDKLILDNLSKYYGSFQAVDRLSVGVPAGECFGLLGINGAGKTSTFMMLTGDSAISGGDAYLNTFSLKTQKDLARRRLGYCPQFDALIGQLTGREMLYLFSRLRGIYEEDIGPNVNMLMDRLLLTQYADKQCQTYSGGNKRKLSTAIALIGDPDVVFLDEPTTGMDPVARRMLWEVLAAVRDSGKTLVLTSHSMEECEALCTRLAIMVNGQFRCLGSPQHLKTKFGQGFTITTKVAYREDDHSTPDLGPLQEFIASTFKDSVLTDVHENMLHYHVKDTQLSWAQVFGEMERARVNFDLEDYLVSQTSLEQVFLSFARMSREDVLHTSSETDSKQLSSSLRRVCCLCCCQPSMEDRTTAFGWNDSERESLIRDDPIV